MAHDLNREFKFYQSHQKDLVEKYNGKFLVIKDLKVVADFRSFEEALEYSQKEFELGTFLIQECLPGEDNYTQTFHTRAIFA